MRVFVDESGSFNWKRPGWSIIAAVSLAEHDGTEAAVLSRMRQWERGLPPSRRDGGEVKGRLVSDDELVVFVTTVLDPARAKSHVTLCGFDSTKATLADMAAFRDQLAVGATPELIRYATSNNRRMSGWSCERAVKPEFNRLRQK